MPKVYTKVNIIVKLRNHKDNYIQGYVKSYRSIMQKAWYRKSEYFHLWHHILYKSNHKPNEWMYKNKVMKVGRGQFITSRKTLSSETGINESKVDRILKCFENEQQIEQQNLYTSRLISVVNYELYQNGEQQSEQQVNSKRTASEQQVNTNNKDKNEKNEKNIKYSFDDFWNQYDKKSSGKVKSMQKWKKLKSEEIEQIKAHVPKYVKFTPDKTYRKNAETYLNQKHWESELEEVKEIKYNPLEEIWNQHQ